MPSRGDIRIGLSGWLYPGWRGKFYPKGLRHRDELPFAASKFRTIEINGTFYRLQHPDRFASWYDQTPDDFQFSVKGPRFITHMLKLNGSSVALANFFGNGILRLGRKLGPILWQLPPSFRFDPGKLQTFLRRLPRSTDAAAALAKKHDSHISGRVWLKPRASLPIHHALEIRHKSFCCLDFLSLLREEGIALVVADSVAWPHLTDITADFMYCRLHGSKEIYASGYDARSLGRWAKRVVSWAAGVPASGPRLNRLARNDHLKRDVYVYFDNDAKVRAPVDAQALARRVDRLLKTGR